eukprot:2271546-Rhodomonas_salina.1
MRADAYRPGIHNTPLDNILRMPLSSEPVTTHVDCNFDVLDDQDLSCSSVSAFEDDNVHPAVLQAQRNISHSVENADGSNTEAHRGNGRVVGLHWGSDLSHDCVHGNVTENRWGNGSVVTGISPEQNHEGPSTGVLTSARRERFSEAPPPLGQPILHWWDCKSKPIANLTDSELGEYLIGHSFVFQFPAYYWPNEKIKCEYNGEALEVVEDAMYQGPAVLKCLISVRKGQPFKKQAKTQIAYLPISKAGSGPDVSVSPLGIR